jgi:hypothetical protein
VPIFLAITADWDARERNRAAWQAVAVAALVIATFTDDRGQPPPGACGDTAAAGSIHHTTLARPGCGGVTG